MVISAVMRSSRSCDTSVEAASKTTLYGVNSRSLCPPTGELSVTMSHFGTMPENRVLEGEKDGYPYNQSYLTNMVE